MTNLGPRPIGAIAGLAPAAVILASYFGTGGPFLPGFLLIPAVCLSAGWLVGPRATGPIRADFVAAGGYFVVAYLLNTTIAAGLEALETIQSGSAANLPLAVHEGATLWIARFAYLPLVGVLLSPATLFWILAVRALRSRLTPSARPINRRSRTS